MANEPHFGVRSSIVSYPASLALPRRQFLYRLGYGLGGLAFTALLAQDRARAGVLAAKTAMGAWVTYGLGTVNENLPAYVVLPELNFPQGGSANWSNGFLPAQYQGTTFRPTGSPMLDLNPPAGVTRAEQRENLDLMAELN